MATNPQRDGYERLGWPSAKPFDLFGSVRVEYLSSASSGGAPGFSSSIDPYEDTARARANT